MMIQVFRTFDRNGNLVHEEAVEVDEGLVVVDDLATEVAALRSALTAVGQASTFGDAKKAITERISPLATGKPR